jgi:hypothetical protein
MFLLAALALSSAFAAAQQAETAASSVIVPRLVNFSGKASDGGKIMTGSVGVTFALYKEQDGGTPLWLETQNVQADAKSNYSVQLGATKAEGLPLDLFSSGEARWLGVTVNGGTEQPRVLLLSVPYALKAADAQTFGGLPLSAFVLATSLNHANVPASGTIVSETVSGTAQAVSGTGTTDFLPLWTNSSGALGNSVLFQSGTGTTAKIGINTTAPAVTLDVNGGENVHGILNLPITGNATASGGKNSQPLDLTASAFNSSSKAAVTQKFQWQTEPVGNNTASPSGALSLLFASGTSAPAETGLKIAKNGVITFASGQTFPGGGSGTVKSVGLSAPTSDFTVSGSPITTSGTLVLNWKTAPTSTDTDNAIVKRDSTGSFNASTINAVAMNVNNNNGLAIIANAVGDAAILGGSSSNSGVSGTSVSGDGVFGDSISGNGVEGDTNTPDAYGVYGTNAATDAIAIFGNEPNPDGFGVEGNGPFGIVGVGTEDAGLFDGNVDVNGSVSKDGGSFKIDHPLDPANKYLYHSFVESPDMMNIYNGNVTTDAQGDAVVTLPDWFEALNTDFRYQLTVLGQFAQAIVANKVANHQFSIKTDKPNVEVSWQVTGIRHDAWADAHRIPVEVVKPAKERGFYKHPELYNAPPEKSVMWGRFPKIMKQMKATAARKAPVASVKTEVETKP